KSPNVLKAIEAAREKGMLVVGLTGKKGEVSYAKLCDACVAVPATNTARIQELHITVGHLICEIVDQMMMRDAKTTKTNGAAKASATGKVVDLPTLLELRAQ